MITIEVRRAKLSRQWRWRAKAANGEIVATSGRETYFNLEDLMQTLRLLFSSDIAVKAFVAGPDVWEELR